MISLGISQAERGRRRPKRSQLDVMLRLCQDIAAFVQTHAPDRSQAFFALDGDTVGLYVLSAAEAYDFELGDKLAEFAAPYIERGLLGSVTLLPASTPEELAAYFDPAKAIRVEIHA
jgi:hypothetical protein